MTEKPLYFWDGFGRRRMDSAIAPESKLNKKTNKKIAWKICRVEYGKIKSMFASKSKNLAETEYEI